MRAHSLLTVFVAAASFALVAACASSPPPAGPHDVSAAKHEEIARAEERIAKAEEAQFDPNARSERPRHCDTAPVGPDEAGVCWGSTSNPTSAHLAAATKHRELAAQHRTES